MRKPPPFVKEITRQKPRMNNNNNNNNTEGFYSNAVITATEGGICNEIIDADSAWATSIERHHSSTSASEWTSSAPTNNTTTPTTTTMPYHSTNEMNNDNDHDDDKDIEQPSSSSPSSSSLPTVSEARHHHGHSTSASSPSSSYNTTFHHRHRRNCCASMITTMLWLKKKIVTRYMELVWISLALIVARAYPLLGSQYILPSITCEWIAVILHFATLQVYKHTHKHNCILLSLVGKVLFCFCFGVISLSKTCRLTSTHVSFL